MLDDAEGSGTRLLAGPFLGEFGWELFCWQGRLRWISRERGYEKTYVYCRPGHELLYEDFAEVNVFPPSVRSNAGKDKAYDVIRTNRRIFQYESSWTLEDCENEGFFDQRFVRFGTPIDATPQVVVHARSRMHRGTDNWPRERYDALIRHFQDLGLDVGVVGTEADSQAFDIDGVFDFRGRPLRDVCDLLAGAKCIIGTSSGPMHLAALCGCPQVVFTDESNFERYRHHWNPFRVSTRIPKGGWQPEVADVVEEAISLIEQEAGAHRSRSDGGDTDGG